MKTFCVHYFKPHREQFPQPSLVTKGWEWKHLPVKFAENALTAHAIKRKKRKVFSKKTPHECLTVREKSRAGWERLFTQALSQESVFCTDPAIQGAHLRFSWAACLSPPSPAILLRNPCVGEQTCSCSMHPEPASPLGECYHTEAICRNFTQQDKQTQSIKETRELRESPPKTLLTASSLISPVKSSAAN